MVSLDALEQFQFLSFYNKGYKIYEVEHFLKFGKLVFSISGRINFVDTDYLLEQLKLDSIEPCLLPQRKSIKGFYSTEEILTSCKKNDLQHLLRECIKVSLDYIVMALKGCYSHYLEFLSSFSQFIIECTEVFQLEKTYFCNDFSGHIVDFLESLFNLLDANYAKDLTIKKVKINALTKRVIIWCMKYYKVRQHIILRTTMKMRQFTANTEAYADHCENITIQEQITSYLLLSKKALQDSITLQSKFLEPHLEVTKPCSRQDMTVFLESLTKMAESSCMNISHLASTCLEQIKTYDGLVEINN